MRMDGVRRVFPELEQPTQRTPHRQPADGRRDLDTDPPIVGSLSPDSVTTSSDPDDGLSRGQGHPLRAKTRTRARFASGQERVERSELLAQVAAALAGVGGG
jgi:hypothetical protein